MAGSEIEIKARQLIWDESESSFETNNHLIKRGEEVVILEPLMRKIGNGIRTFNELPFDTNHNIVKLTEASTLTLYNVVPQTTFFFNRTDSVISI